MSPRLFSITLVLVAIPTLAADPPEPKFRAQTIDDKIQIGYGVAVADVDGDGKPDVLLADKKQFVWYRNPTWEKFLIAENLTEKDNVCLAAQDLDGDGKCEIAVGAEWNPGDTEKSGAVFYLIPPGDRTQKWEPVKFPSVEPTTHRMKWLNLGEKQWGLFVLPLHGRGNKNGEGAPVKVLCYPKPADPRGEWKAEVVDESLHMTHNFERLVFPDHPEQDNVLIGGKEGANFAYRENGAWKSRSSVQHSAYASVLGGMGEVRVGWAMRGGQKRMFGAAVEPMHGNMLVFYQQDTSDPESKTPPRTVLTSSLTDGHAVACGDFLGLGTEQIAVGWRGKLGVADSTIGVAVWMALDAEGTKWRQTVIDPDGMACEDLVLADLNADGKLDIVASGRATKNVKIYFNETAR